MKKWLAYLSAVLCMVLTLCGCGTEMEEAMISDTLEIVEDALVDELENMADETGDTVDITDTHEDADSSAQDTADVETEADAEKDADVDSEEIWEDDSFTGGDQNVASDGAYTVVEGGSYTSKEEVALYIYTYGELPVNFITKSEAQELGWVSKEGNLWDVAPGKSIGGDRYGNYEQLLPDGKYKECDINYQGGYRGDERLVYSEDGYIYYTGDHYESFTQLYPEEN